MALAAILFIFACSKKQAEEIKPAAPGSPVEKVTYTSFVEPLFTAKCAKCHATGKPSAGIWNFTGYSSVIDKAATIKQVVLVSKTMPLTGSLSAAELQSLQAWYDQGNPQ